MDRVRKLGCAFWAVAVYLLIAVTGWIDFARTNHDGLADVGLYLLTAPVALLELLLVGSGRGRLTPEGHGYLADLALYYVPAVAVTATLIWGAVRLAVRLWTRTSRDSPGGDA